VWEFLLVGPHLFSCRGVNLFPETVTATSKALFINYGEEAFNAMKAIKKN
jgi:hypothetical protein